MLFRNFLTGKHFDFYCHNCHFTTAKILSKCFAKLQNQAFPNFHRLGVYLHAVWSKFSWTVERFRIIIEAFHQLWIPKILFCEQLYERHHKIIHRHITANLWENLSLVITHLNAEPPVYCMSQFFDPSPSHVNCEGICLKLRTTYLLYLTYLTESSVSVTEIQRNNWIYFARQLNYLNC